MTEALPILTQRRIEAAFAKGIFDEMKAELGEATAKRILANAVIKLAKQAAAEMAIGAERSNRLERTAIDAVEAAVLQPFVGRTFDAVVIDLWKKNRGEVALAEPAVIGPCDDVHELGVKVKTRLEEADVDRRTIRFTRVRTSGEDAVGPPRGP